MWSSWTTRILRGESTLGAGRNTRQIAIRTDPTGSTRRFACAELADYGELAAIGSSVLLPLLGRLRDDYATVVQAASGALVRLVGALLRGGIDGEAAAHSKTHDAEARAREPEHAPPAHGGCRSGLLLEQRHDDRDRGSRLRRRALFARS